MYTQEEIEIARASGERLIDTQASAEIARRLMTLQRQRLMESQVLDQRTRRVLHDDILPELHTAMLTLSGANSQNGVVAETVTHLAEVHHQIADLLHELPTSSIPEVTRSGLLGALRQVADKELSEAFEAVAWQITPEVEDHLLALPMLVQEVLFYAAREAMRNAAHHAGQGEAESLTLTVSANWAAGLKLVIEDNGEGMGTISTHAGGSGQGLALHSTMMAVVGGTLEVESVSGAYTRVSLLLPEG